MHAVLFKQNKDVIDPLECGVCKKEREHGWSIHPQSLEEEDFLGEHFKNYVEIYFCDICLEQLKKECETNGFNLKIVKDDNIPDWVIESDYLPDDDED